jgi:hypothetical protein
MYEDNYKYYDKPVLGAEPVSVELYNIITKKRDICIIIILDKKLKEYNKSQHYEKNLINEIIKYDNKIFSGWKKHAKRLLYILNICWVIIAILAVVVICNL